MKRILFDHHAPFALTHGGFQIQIQQTAAALQSRGVEVDFVRWWDDSQRADLIHFFGTAPVPYLQLAAGKGIPTVMTTLFTAACNRSDARLRWQGFLVNSLLRVPAGAGMKEQLGWLSHNLCGRNVVGLAAEQTVLELVFKVPRARIDVVPLGLSQTFLSAGPGTRRGANLHLICTGTITERKNSIELAQMARKARVPILFVGKPYSFSDPYWKRFEALIDREFVRFEPHVATEEEMVRKLHSARGFVLLSDYENWCLSAHEAAACGLPVLLPDQKWSRERFDKEASYFGRGFSANVQRLREFYERCVDATPPAIRLYSWDEVAQRLEAVYDRLSSTSR